jgi:hypothetical protein|tara:strand:- start:42 stop:398 length:357 start_codon:yes stop_codon:yes gene_type:complete
MRRELYRHHAELEDVECENGQVLKRLLKLDINKDILISYFINERNEYRDEKISFRDFKMRVINQVDFIEMIFLVDIEEENFGVRLSGGEMWVASFNQNKSDSIFKTLIDKNIQIKTTH